MVYQIQLNILIGLLMIFVLVTGCAWQPRTTERAPDKTIAEPESTLLYNVLAAEMAGRRGDLANAVKYYRGVIKDSRNIDIIKRATGIMLYAKDHKAAAEAVAHWMSLQPASLEARQLSTVVSLQQGDVEAALEAMEWILDHSPSSRKYRVIAALLNQVDKRNTRLSAMEGLLARRLQDIQAHVLYARMAHDGEMFQKALNAAAHALELDPGHSEANILWARALIGLGRTEEALTGLDEALDRQPEDDLLRLNYARILVGVNRYESAAAEFDRLLARVPDDSDLLYSAALVAMQIKDVDKAETYLMKLGRSPDRKQEAWYYLGRLYEVRKNYLQALAWFEQVAPGPLYLEAQLAAARTQGKMGQVDKAQARYANLRKHHKDQRATIWLGESEMLRDMERHQSAYEVLDMAVNDIPEDLDLLYSRALAAEKIGRIDMLERDLKNLLDIEPDHAHALNALGYTLADQTNRYQEALGYIEKAIKLSPDDPAIIDSLGWVHYRLGNLDKALKYLRKAIVGLNDGEVSAHLAEVLWISGQKEEARAVLEKALRHHPDNENLLEVIERLND